jgi:hypothetical protein
VNEWTSYSIVPWPLELPIFIKILFQILKLWKQNISNGKNTLSFKALVKFLARVTFIVG